MKITEKIGSLLSQMKKLLQNTMNWAERSQEKALGGNLKNGSKRHKISDRKK